MEIRNIAIIAHVDHGKTTLTDAILRQCGAIEANVSMDSNALEKERGITIYAKNASVIYPRPDSGRKPTKINIVDTPGHADFGSEVERVLRSIDSVLLIVDAQEGPMPQTRFVLRKSLQLGLKPIVVINKIDKPAADPERAHEKVLELFYELGASSEQVDFTVVYSISKDGIAKRSLADNSENVYPLLDVILEKVPPVPSERSGRPFLLQPFNLAYDNFLGRMGIARVHEGVITDKASVYVKKTNGDTRMGKITKLFTFNGLKREEIPSAEAGDIVMIAGLPDIYIGETVAQNEDAEPLPAIAVDDPTIVLNFLVNNSPFAGQEGKFVTSRQLRERLEKELEVNVGLRVDFNSPESFTVSGRGELHIAVLLENMRREGYEMQVSQPQAIVREVNGVSMEPFEEVIIDAPERRQGVIIEKLGVRGFILKDMATHEKSVRLSFEGPTRGILGYRGQFIIDTRGDGILSSRFIEFRPYAGEIRKRAVGSMTSMATGKALGYALWNLQERGNLYIGPATQVYEGMVIGDTSKGDELSVNPTKGKQLTNVRASGSDEAIDLVPPLTLSIERGLEIMTDDEYLEITPSNVRLRKKYLSDADRYKSKRKDK
ncbi:MAG: GTP-binding protein TypA [Candidatus Taylorbacteria bacterium RIFCSPLOWO2_12_FULL_47_20]|uniref:50S ribosomal subunit assembly factor BipA n=2 Tax=Candidatus Tayloriibacteriota TaxID=1817919 RepID=A0A1G2P832_9BACT|nr:MAG: GTP-binding protein TypA [Candidatus Taylorbacteria bacterium RIFCSPLOWO2_02_FULL_46_40]OHA44525.1 MAG: GTP-binding protein TypA [Candidatus Taylorbacteria bacterium RIFCSPLOWO2_12_FULL_47_20]